MKYFMKNNTIILAMMPSFLLLGNAEARLGPLWVDQPCPMVQEAAQLAKVGAE